MKESLEELRQALEKATSIVALTGAGISAESGVPTFRGPPPEGWPPSLISGSSGPQGGPNGLWRNFSPEKLATPEAFAKDACLVWEWYDWRREIIHRARPNPGHLALAELERRKRSDGRAVFTLVTQNVDGLHDRAGSNNPVKLHGDIWLVRCTGCGAVERNDDVPLKELPPRCPCGSLLRPGVVWFGEPLPEETWQRAAQASARAQVFLVIGTSAVVYPAAGLAHEARGGGARLAVVNPGPTPLDDLADWVLSAPAGEVLPRLL